MLYVLIGAPGSGKSTWCRHRMLDNDYVQKWERISRDDIRFSMLKPGEDYFSHEGEVYEEFVKRIAKSLTQPWVEHTIADATQLSKKARELLFSSVDKHLPQNFKYEVVFVYFDVPLSTCLERNAKRTGRALVPEETIKNMYKSISFPSLKECHSFKNSECVLDKIYVVRE